jgi:hypothetical protein
MFSSTKTLKKPLRALSKNKDNEVVLVSLLRSRKNWEKWWETAGGDRELAGKEQEIENSQTRRKIGESVTIIHYT